MDVQFTPEFEKKLADLAAKTGRAPAQLLEDALAGPSVARLATLDWTQCPSVERVPGKMSGAWVLRGTRMPVATIFRTWRPAPNIEDIMNWYDGLDREHAGKRRAPPRRTADGTDALPRSVYSYRQGRSRLTRIGT